MVTNFNALARSYDHVVIDAGEAAGPEIDRISEVAPNAVLVTDTLSNAATTSARERLLASGFADVRILVAAYGTHGETAVAACMSRSHCVDALTGPPPWQKIIEYASTRERRWPA